MRHRRPLVPALAACVGLVVAAALLPHGSSAAVAGPRDGARAGSDIALKAGAFGTRVSGGQVPLSSGMTAFSVIACASKPGVTRQNTVLGSELPGLGRVAGVKTRNWTRKRGETRHAFSRSSTTEVILADGALGRLSIRGVTSWSHAWYDGSTFHSDTRSSIGRIVLTPANGEPMELDLPMPGAPIEIPGLARIALGHSAERSGRDGASATAAALRIDVLPTDTRLTVARSKAEAHPGVRNGRFNGYSAGTEVKVLDGLLTSGRNPVSYLPCQGTDGEVQGRDDVDLDLGGGLHVEGVGTQQWAKRFAHRSKAWEQGSVAGLSLGDGALVVDAVVGKAIVVRHANGKRERRAVTRVGAITVDGETTELPLDQTLEIPGVAELEPRVVERLPGGLKVVALRITLLEGAGAVIDLGVARTRILR